MTPLPHPRIATLFESPVAPGSGWPGDPASPDTPVAKCAEDAARIAAHCSEFEDLDATISVCRACPRLVKWREDIAVTKRAQWRDEPYWGRPVPSFGDPSARMVIIGLAPAAHGANRTGRMSPVTSPGTGFTALYMTPTLPHKHRALTLRMVSPFTTVASSPRYTAHHQTTGLDPTRSALALSGLMMS